MFFLIRCVFWLGLVFCHIAGLNTVSPADLASKAGGLAGSLASGLARDGAAAAVGAAQAQLKGAQVQCLAAPDACLAKIDKLSRLAQAGGVGSAAIAASTAAKTAAMTSGKPSAAASPSPRSRDTLLASDRAAAWRPPPVKSAGDL